MHVKRKFGSSSLSHLFGQGAVSADLFARSREYRKKIRAKLTPAFRDLIPLDRPDTAAYEVAYAIIGKWGTDPPSEKLPFFSKVNLRRHATDMQAMGYKVTYRKIDLEEG